MRISQYQAASPQKREQMTSGHIGFSVQVTWWYGSRMQPLHHLGSGR